MDLNLENNISGCIMHACTLFSRFVQELLGVWYMYPISNILTQRKVLGNV